MPESNIPFHLRAFFDRLFEEAGFKDLNSDLREQMYQDLSSRLESWFFLTAKKHLSENQLSHLLILWLVLTHLLLF